MHWFFDENFSQEATLISSEELRHLRSLRIRPNEEIAITDGRGAVFYCKAINPETGEVEVLRSEIRAAQSPRMHLVQALAREIGTSKHCKWQSSSGSTVLLPGRPNTR